MGKVVKYEISRDGVGLLAYHENGSYYYIHSNELTELERWIFELLKKTTPMNRTEEIRYLGQQLCASGETDVTRINGIIKRLNKLVTVELSNRKENENVS